MNRTILNQLRQAVKRGLDEKASQIIELHGAYLSKRDITHLISFMEKIGRYPIRVARYIYVRSPHRAYFQPVRNLALLMDMASDMNGIELMAQLFADNRFGLYGVFSCAVRSAGKDGSTALVELLLSNDRIDPASSSNYAIGLACENGHTNMVRILLQDRRIDPSTDSDYALRIACANGHYSVVKLLLEDSRVDPSNAIWCASEAGHTNIARILLQDTRITQDIQWCLPLPTASYNGGAEMIRLLLADERIDPCRKANLWINEACENGKIDMVRLLLEDSRICSAGLDGAMSIAKSRGYRDIMDLLMMAV